MRFLEGAARRRQGQPALIANHSHSGYRAITMPRKLFFAFLCLSLLALSSCGGDGEEADNSRRSVVTAFYPLTFIASNVAGDEADVTSITPAGVEPHVLELTAAQVRRISDADLLIYIGQGFQPAVD